LDFFSAPAEREIAVALEARQVAAPIAARLARYAMLVLDGNRKLNLSGAKTPLAIVEHLVDSLTVLPYVEDPYVDVGSGAGFPAIPVAIASNLRPTLIETTIKKARFLEGLGDALGIVVTILAERAEAAAHGANLREAFASATCRAVTSASASLELTLPFLRPGGVAVLQRGGLEPAERTALEDAALILGGRLEDEIRLEGVRRILLVRKTAPTPLRYPRRAGIPDRRPLCE
jgi:16S rRNA (guanine527-N7)-methyltransferase